MTRQERKLWYEFLRGLPYRFRRQRVIGKYIVDFYCAEKRLVIELDGSQEPKYHMESFGLVNTNRRIALYFGESYGIQIMRSENGARVQIRLPKEEV